ncbi:MAG: hypothetical protein SFZ03_03090 [Candidatus Melainabacteria bacterium]|nr:hypothetical protein [Candidatus Melainabacteria bacterium]
MVLQPTNSVTAGPTAFVSPTAAVPTNTVPTTGVTTFGGTLDGRGSDFLNPNTVLSVGNIGIQTVTSNNPIQQLVDPNLLGDNPNALSILNTTDSTLANVLSPTFGSNFLGTGNGSASGGTGNPVLDTFGIPFQPFGINPNPVSILSGTLFFGGRILPGGGITPTVPTFPLGNNSSVFSPTGSSFPTISNPTFFNTGSFVPNGLTPTLGNSLGNGFGTVAPSQFFPLVFPTTNSFFPTYPTFPQPFLFGGSFPTLGSPLLPQTFQSRADSNPVATLLLTLNQLIRQSGFSFPDVVPTGVPGGLTSFLSQFPSLDSSAQGVLNTALANPTTVNDAILSTAGISDTGGLFEQGVVTNPFVNETFLSDTNPFDRLRSGLLVTDGNGNGKAKGTQVSDIIFGTNNRANIIDGRGGQDTLVGGQSADLIQIRPGDTVASLSGDDVLFFDFTPVVGNPFLFNTRIDAGSGMDTLIIPVTGDPTQTADLPRFSRNQQGQITLTYQGRSVVTQNVDRFIITDTAGNIGSIFEPA